MSGNLFQNISLKHKKTFAFALIAVVILVVFTLVVQLNQKDRVLAGRAVYISDDIATMIDSLGSDDDLSAGEINDLVDFLASFDENGGLSADEFNSFMDDQYPSHVSANGFVWELATIGSNGAGVYMTNSITGSYDSSAATDISVGGNVEATYTPGEVGGTLTITDGGTYIGETGDQLNAIPGKSMPELGDSEADEYAWISPNPQSGSEGNYYDTAELEKSLKLTEQQIAVYYPQNFQCNNQVFENEVLPYTGYGMLLHNRVKYFKGAKGVVNKKYPGQLINYPQATIPVDPSRSMLCKNGKYHICDSTAKGEVISNDFLGADVLCSEVVNKNTKTKQFVWVECNGISDKQFSVHPLASKGNYINQKEGLSSFDNRFLCGFQEDPNVNRYLENWYQCLAGGKISGQGIGVEVGKSVTLASGEYKCTKGGFVAPKEICTDGKDNDKNGLIDCADSTCNADQSCINYKGQGAGLSKADLGKGVRLRNVDSGEYLCATPINDENNILETCSSKKEVSGANGRTSIFKFELDKDQTYYNLNVVASDEYVCGNRKNAGAEVCSGLKDSDANWDTKIAVEYVPSQEIGTFVSLRQLSNGGRYYCRLSDAKSSNHIITCPKVLGTAVDGRFEVEFVSADKPKSKDIVPVIKTGVEFYLKDTKSDKFVCGVDFSKKFQGSASAADIRPISLCDKDSSLVGIYKDAKTKMVFETMETTGYLGNLLYLKFSEKSADDRRRYLYLNADGAVGHDGIADTYDPIYSDQKGSPPYLKENANWEIIQNSDSTVLLKHKVTGKYFCSLNKGNNFNPATFKLCDSAKDNGKFNTIFEIVSDPLAKSIAPLSVGEKCSADLPQCGDNLICESGTCKGTGDFECSQDSQCLSSYSCLAVDSRKLCVLDKKVTLDAYGCAATWTYENAGRSTTYNGCILSGNTPWCGTGQGPDGSTYVSGSDSSGELGYWQTCKAGYSCDKSFEGQKTDDGKWECQDGKLISVTYADNCISNTELTGKINLWKQGKLTNSQITGVINAWKKSKATCGA